MAIDPRHGWPAGGTGGLTALALLRGRGAGVESGGELGRDEAGPVFLVAPRLSFGLEVSRD